MKLFPTCLRQKSTFAWGVRILSVSALAFSSLVLGIGCGDESNPTGVEDADKVGTYQPQPLPVPPSPEDQVDLLERALAGQILTWDDAEIAEYFQTQYVANLSSASQAAIDAFTAEINALGHATYDFETYWDTYSTPQTQQYQDMVNELVPLLDFEIEAPQKDGGATLVALAGLAAAAVGCVGKAEACMDDAIDNFTLCANQECPDGKEVDTDCCFEEGKEDISNCAWTCGFNEADPEYNVNCCKRTKLQQAQPYNH